MGRTALVTGGTGGLGSAVVARLRADGWRCVVPWLVERELERLPPGDDLTLVQADLFDPSHVEQVVAAAGDDLTGVVNLVGGYAEGPKVAETPLEDFERMLTLNLRPTFLVTRAALPRLIAAGGGSIVCVGSRTALQPYAGVAGYVTAKAAVIAFAAAVHADHHDDGIRCNAVLPALIDTPANRAAMPDLRGTPPAEIAAMIAFLLSDDGRVTSGAAIPVYG